jgi:hypothetical protein
MAILCTNPNDEQFILHFVCNQNFIDNMSIIENLKVNAIYKLVANIQYINGKYKMISTKLNNKGMFNYFNR